MIATPLRRSIDDRQQPLGILHRQNGGRFVEDHDAGILRQGLGDLDHLLMRDRQAADQRIGADGKASSAISVAARA